MEIQIGKTVHLDLSLRETYGVLEEDTFHNNISSFSTGLDNCFWEFHPLAFQHVSEIHIFKMYYVHACH